MNSSTLRHRRTRRTTVTLEADVADFIEVALREDKTLKEKQLINKLLRAGIKNESLKAKADFKISGFKTSLAEGMTAAEIERMLDEV